MSSDNKNKDKFPLPPPINTANHLQGLSPFNTFVNELSPLTPGQGRQKLYVLPIKKFSFSEQIHDIVLRQDPGIKDKEGLEGYFPDDTMFSPYMRRGGHEDSNPYISTRSLGSAQLNAPTDGENLGSSNNKRIIPNNNAHISLNNVSPSQESDYIYKTPTFCPGTSTNSDHSYKSPKFVSTNTPPPPLRLPQALIDKDSPKGDTSKQTNEKEEKNGKNSGNFMGCNCKKSRCLKLYCECIRSERVCIASCNCVDCKNNLQNQELRKKAIHSILIKNPNYFGLRHKNLEPLTKNSPNDSKNGNVNENVKRGCNCKKSYCKKKYCECYGIGLKCNDLCKCEGCRNKEENDDVEDTSLVKRSFEENLYDVHSEEEKDNNFKKKKRRKV